MTVDTTITDSRLVNLRDSIPGDAEWTEGKGPRGFQLVEVNFPNGYGLSFQVEHLTGAGGSYCGPGTVEARLIKWGSEDAMFDVLWPKGWVNPLDPGRGSDRVYGYMDAEACRELARRVRAMPERDKTERF